MSRSSDSFIDRNGMIDEQALTAVLIRSGKIPQNEIKIIVHNLVELVKSGYLRKEKISIIVHNITDDTKFRANFIKNPKKAIESANPQPSP
ncbi:MAG: hypothetical protein EAX90_14030 [Candidatus Heimdallarchaeota archaeon]|nr:hypothetical protein [Candidatus Heimdallarchaeota archaeon]